MHPASVCLGLAALFCSCAHAAPLQVYILAGQSNMVGSSPVIDLPATLQPPMADVPYWVNESQITPFTMWQPLDPALRGGLHGMEVTFADARRQHEPVAIIKTAWNGSSLVDDWRVGDNDGFYAAMTQTISDALAALHQPYEVAGLAWLQGESDTTAARSAVYGAHLTALIAGVRSLVNTPDLPVAIGRLWQPVYFGPGRYGDEVREAQGAVAALDPHVYIVDLDGLPLKADNIHYADQQEVGRRFAAVLPEPATLVIVLGGLMLMGVRRH